MGFGSFGMGEMIFVFLIVLLLFGAKRLPEIGASLGKGIREFKSSVREIEHELKVPEPQIHRSASPPPAVAGGEERTTERAGEDDGGEPKSLSDA